MIDSEQLYELGVDFKSSFRFKDGDIELVKYDENLIQAISNRFNTKLDELEHFYEDYGSILSSFFGWKKNSETLDFIKSEIETVLRSEQRLYDWNIEVKYDDEGIVVIELILYPNPENTIEINFELTDDGVEVVE